MKHIETVWDKPMTSRLITVLGIASFSFSMNVFATQSIYCPQNHGYINIGMTADQVTASCGQPLSKQQSNSPVMQKVPVQQLFYNNEASPTAFYGVWTLPVGVSTGAHLEVDVINNKVSAIRINGSNTNAFSICGGADIQAGDPVGKVYGSCGVPSVVNKTFVNHPIPSNQKPEVWIYQPDQYQAPISLTFVNGKLQSID